MGLLHRWRAELGGHGHLQLPPVGSWGLGRMRRARHLGLSTLVHVPCTGHSPVPTVPAAPGVCWGLGEGRPVPARGTFGLFPLWTFCRLLGVHGSLCLAPSSQAERRAPVPGAPCPLGAPAGRCASAGKHGGQLLPAGSPTSSCVLFSDVSSYFLKGGFGVWLN